MVVPGDVAPRHRHSQSALRFVLEGKGAYTAVDGERTAMAPGDFIITPSMTWHDHSNRNDQPMFWLDGLDIPIVQFFDCSFAGSSKEDQRGDLRGRPATALRATAAICCRLTLKRSVEDLADLQLSLCLHPRGAGEGQAARRVGRLPRPEAEIQQPRDRRFRDADHRDLHPAAAEGFQDRTLSLDGCDRVLPRLKAKGRTRVGDATFEWGPRDLFVVPSWQWVTHEAEDDAVLFSFSDRPVQQKLDLFRGGSRECVRQVRDRVLSVVPAKAGTHTAGWFGEAQLSVRRYEYRRLPRSIARGMGPGLRRDDADSCGARLHPHHHCRARLPPVQQPRLQQIDHAFPTASPNTDRITTPASN